MENKLYIVTGMGRSGSTFLAESLENNGVNMGDDMWYSQKEDIKFVDLNKKIFQHLGYKGNMGDMPPTVEEILSVKDIYQDEFKRLFEARMGELEGIKDPRMVITYPIWKDVIGNDDPFFYITVRKPEKVGDSLYRKITEKGYNYDKELGISVAQEYARRVILMMKDIYKIIL